MKVILHTAKELNLEMWVKIFGVEDLWKMELRGNLRDNTVQLFDGASLTLTMDKTSIPGRTPDELEYLVVQYGGMEFKIAPDINKTTGELNPIVIIDGSKDYWTNVLRHKALEAQWREDKYEN